MVTFLLAWEPWYIPSGTIEFLFRKKGYKQREKKLVEQLRFRSLVVVSGTELIVPRFLNICVCCPSATIYTPRSKNDSNQRNELTPWSGTMRGIRIKRIFSIHYSKSLRDWGTWLENFITAAGRVCSAAFVLVRRQNVVVHSCVSQPESKTCPVFLFQAFGFRLLQVYTSFLGWLMKLFPPLGVRCLHGILFTAFTLGQSRRKRSR